MNDRWPARRGLAAGVHVLLATLPALAALAVWFLADALDVLAARPVGTRLVLTGLVAVTVAVAVHRLLPRVLPLTMLLRMALVFPDAAPSRWATAMRAGSTRNLQDLVDQVEEVAARDDVREAAERILALAAALSLHDRRTRGHSERVRALSEVLAQALGVTGDDLERLRWAALLHDLGKLHVHPDILTKPHELSPEEWVAVRLHPVEGARLVAPLHGFLGSWATTVRYHHERWDGDGYPEGVAGPAIPLGARIVAVADAFEVMTSSGRLYRATVSLDEARRELVRASGHHFDPAVVRAFLTLQDRQVRRAMGAWFVVGQLLVAPFGARRLGQRLGRAGADELAPVAEGPRLAPDAHVHPDAAVHGDASTHADADGGEADASSGDADVAGMRDDG